MTLRRGEDLASIIARQRHEDIEAQQSEAQRLRREVEQLRAEKRKYAA
ncbi:MAG: hypothetical protein LBR86_01825 [Tannerella sp.]|nr:hypothetical protein [Tannerella sp.]